MAHIVIISTEVAMPTCFIIQKYKKIPAVLQGRGLVLQSSVYCNLKVTGRENTEFTALPLILPGFQ